MKFEVKEFFVFRLEVMSLFDTASFNKRVFRLGSIGILTRILFQVGDRGSTAVKLLCYK